jgi:hypothetical protein
MSRYNEGLVKVRYWKPALIVRTSDLGAYLLQPVITECLLSGAEARKLIV